jgi:excinuclease ABC subunit B
MQAAIDETDRRRAKQAAFNAAHGITPNTIRKAIRRGIEMELKARKTARAALSTREAETEYDRAELIATLQQEMLDAAAKLEFEKAAALRDQVAQLKSMPELTARGRVTRSEVEAPRPKPGMAGSAGSAARSRRRRAP